MQESAATVIRFPLKGTPPTVSSHVTSLNLTGELISTATLTVTTSAPPRPCVKAARCLPVLGAGAHGSVERRSGLHFSSSAARCLTCPGLSFSHDPCVCPRDQRFHLRKSASLNIGVFFFFFFFFFFLIHSQTFVDMLDQSADSSASHEKQETEEVVQLQEGEVDGEEQTAVAISGVSHAAFSDHNVQYQFRTENSGGQVTYRVVQLTDEHIEASDDSGAVSVVSTAAFSGAPQAVTQTVIQNPFSNGGSPVGEDVGGQTRFAYFPAAATVSDATAVSVQATAEPTLTPAGGQFYVMMSPPEVLQTSPRTIAPRTHTYTAKVEGPRALRDERRRAQHNEVERRRRDKINNWIVTLSKIIPDCSIDSRTGASKGGILSKACDYIRELRQSNQRLQESYKEVEQVEIDNKLLRQQIEELKNDNALLRAQLQQHGIESNGDSAPQ
ncbi:upstream stimulatory factor 2 [Thalassophryne amazonica]|uniref:upstream stimulatory factor 2 n=1 Tax=Thalassophryne amazonica TaxID=390379 RepID=UPI0014708908|nr:upstream stimulatory factor 2 [Thalassophryne amazonica]